MRGTGRHNMPVYSTYYIHQVFVTNVFENKNSQDKIYIKDPQKNIKKNSLNLNSEIEKIFQKK